MDGIQVLFEYLLKKCEGVFTSDDQRCVLACAHTRQSQLGRTTVASCTSSRHNTSPPSVRCLVEQHREHSGHFTYFVVYLEQPSLTERFYNAK